MRTSTLAFLLAFTAADARGELPVIAPQGETAPAPVTRPIATETPATAIPATAVPTMVMTPWSVNCQPAAACVDPCAPTAGKRPGVLTGFKNWLCGTSALETCGTTCPVPAVTVVALPRPCPTPIVKPTADCSTCETGSKSRLSRTGAACEKIKAWFCWKPCNEQLLPVLCPDPYRSPATAYLGECREPPAPLPCGTCKKVGAKATCETGTCPTPAATVAAASKPSIVGWTPIYANYAPATPAASPIVPVGAILPAAKPKPASLLTRPFTSP